MSRVSFVVRSVHRPIKFYEEVLGFMSIKRPSSFKFHGAWLYNYGIGIHLLQCNFLEEDPKKKGVINPKDNHISFQCSDMNLLIRKLEGMTIEYGTAVVEEGGIQVDQLFFHDPDGYMAEICNCDNILLSHFRHALLSSPTPCPQSILVRDILWYNLDLALLKQNLCSSRLWSPT